MGGSPRHGEKCMDMKDIQEAEFMEYDLRGKGAWMLSHIWERTSRTHRRMIFSIEQFLLN